jgi:hypothetical protein
LNEFKSSTNRNFGDFSFFYSVFFFYDEEDALEKKGVELTLELLGKEAVS